MSRHVKVNNFSLLKADLHETIVSKKFNFIGTIIEIFLKM